MLILLTVSIGVLGLPAFPVSGGQAPDVWNKDIAVTQWLDGGTSFESQSLNDDTLRGNGEHARTDWTVSAPIPAEDVVMAGADWGGDPDVRVQIRGGSSAEAGQTGAGYRQSGSWQDWQQLRVESEEHQPDPGSSEAERATDASAPAWFGRIDRLQVRVAGTPPDGLTLKTVGMSGGAGPDYVPLSMRGGAAAQAQPAQPNIVRRDAWDPRGECTPRSAPDYATDVRFSYIHHTASSNSYGPSEAPSMVLAFCKYHRNSRGWKDIGYNFLVDKYGRIYEGRAGGITKPVIGAHAAGFNAGSTGVATIGNFESARPTPELVEGIRKLLAWKLDVHHVDPRGSSEEISGGGGTNRVPEGRKTTLPTVVGHRDTGQTACPGAHLYDYITDDRLRTDIAERGQPKLYGIMPAFEEQPVIGERPKWDVQLEPDSAWQLTIRDSDGEVVRRASDDAVGEVGIRWDLRDANGNEVEPGAYTAAFETQKRDATPITTQFEVAASTERRFGPERITTSVQLSRWAFDDHMRAERGRAQAGTVIIASAEAFPDALVATPLAASYDAPVLLSNRAGLSDEVSDEIQRLGADDAILVGGPKRLSGAVESDLRQAGIDDIERLAGPTRYHTAGRVADRIVQREHPKEALLALGQHPNEDRAFPDALIAGAFGGQFDLPVLLVQPHDLTPPSRWVLEQRDWSRAVSLIGGRHVVDTDVKRAAERASGAEVREFAGSDRYSTSRIVADELLKRWDDLANDPDEQSNGLEVMLTTGENWPDALGAGAAAAQENTAFLLVPDRHLDQGPDARGWLKDHAAALVHAVVAGGPNAVSPAVTGEVDTIIRSEGPHKAPPEDWPNGGGSGQDGDESPIDLPTPVEPSRQVATTE